VESGRGRHSRPLRTRSASAPTRSASRLCDRDRPWRGCHRRPTGRAVPNQAPGSALVPDHGPSAVGRAGDNLPGAGYPAATGRGRAGAAELRAGVCHGVDVAVHPALAPASGGGRRPVHSRRGGPGGPAFRDFPGPDPRSGTALRAGRLGRRGRAVGFRRSGRRCRRGGPGKRSRFRPRRDRLAPRAASTGRARPDDGAAVPRVGHRDWRFRHNRAVRAVRMGDSQARS
jgi:hypothetical protein